MSEYNLPNHVPFCGCTKCKIHRLSHQSHPSSTLNAGLFGVGATEVKLADLTDAQGRKLKDVVPSTALTVSLRNVSIDDLCLDRQDGKSRVFAAQETVELPVADLDKFTTGPADGCSVAVSYTRSMGDKE